MTIGVIDAEFTVTDDAMSEHQTMNDPSRGDWRDAWRDASPMYPDIWTVDRWRAHMRHDIAYRTAAICAICGDHLGPRDPVYVGRLFDDKWVGHASICEMCTGPFWSGSSPSLCEGECGRMVSISTSVLRRSNLIVCSGRCYGRRRTRLHRQVIHKQCTECYDTFIPSRADAFTCSAACRQRVYRRRAALRIANSTETALYISRNGGAV